VLQLALLAATIGAFAFLLASLWAALKLTFLGVPESAPQEERGEQEEEEEEEEEAEENTGRRRPS
jgi:ribosomal protein L12E/L44/L45/RPP1/RPP2